MVFVRMSELPKLPYETVCKESASRLDQLREQLWIPWFELTKIAIMVVGRSVLDCQWLSESENEAVILYLRENMNVLEKKYKAMVWEE